MSAGQQRTRIRWAVMGLGVLGLIAGGSAVVIGLVVAVLLIAPLIVWLGWNVLDFAVAIGAPELGFWGIVLLTLFLVGGVGLRIVIVLAVWLFDPTWLAGSAELHWPQPEFRTFVALVLLLLVAHGPAHTHQDRKSRRAVAPAAAADPRRPNPGHFRAA